MKIVAFGLLNYLKNKWNWFDLTIVLLSLIELGVQDVKGLSILRTFRLVCPFLPRDASAERGDEIACRLSVRPSVTIRYRVQIDWNSSKIISRPNSLRPLLWLTPTWAIWCNGNTPKMGVEYGWGQTKLIRAAIYLAS